MEGKSLRLGLGQLLVEGGEPRRNLDRALELIDQAAEQKCQMLLLPEVLDLGWTHPSAKNEALPIPGPRSDVFCRAAREKGIYICAGLTEKAGDRVYNAAILVNDSGEIILKYRKINELEVGHEFYAVGDRLSVVETPFGVIGVNICSDNYRDGLDIGHVLARMGAQLILSPCAWTSDYFYTEGTDPYKDKWFGPYHHLASLFDLIVAGCTCVGYIVGGPYEGKKMIGCSLAVDKNGIVAQGRYNEFAGELTVVDLKIPARGEKGTAIGRMLKEKGYLKQ